MAVSKQKLYEGKAKVIFSTHDASVVIQRFKDSVTAFNNKKSGSLPGKGIINNYISALLMDRLNAIGIKTHFIKLLNSREQMIKHLQMIPVEVVIRNYVAGSLCKRTGIQEGEPLKCPIVEYYYKGEGLEDPMLNEDHVLALNLLLLWELEEIKEISYRINDFLQGLFVCAGLKMPDVKLEFGRKITDRISDDQNSSIILGDEISPDSCRLWDLTTNEKFDKDCFRFDLRNDVMEGYKEVARRINALPNLLGSYEKNLTKEEMDALIEQSLNDPI